MEEGDISSVYFAETPNPTLFEVIQQATVPLLLLEIAAMLSGDLN